MHTFAAVLIALAVTPANAPAQTQAGEPGARKKVVAAGDRYKKSGLYRWLFGSGYRDLWLMPFEVDVLNLQTFGGGLTPTRVVGHGQSMGLAFKGADGRLYTFRPLLKDPTNLLPVELRETFARGFVTDQMSSGHPAGHTMVPPFLRAVDVVHNEPRIVLMPDDPALGEYRDEFKGQLGDIEEFGGSPGIVKAEENIDGEDLWKRLRESPAVRVDARAYLRARLVDQLVGDWDRHRNQWRWAKVAGNDRWIPIPEDRDQAFVKFNGLVIAIVRQGLPLLVDYGPKYSEPGRLDVRRMGRGPAPSRRADEVGLRAGGGPGEGCDHRRRDRRSRPQDAAGVLREERRQAHGSVEGSPRRDSATGGQVLPVPLEAGRHLRNRRRRGGERRSRPHGRRHRQPRGRGPGAVLPPHVPPG